MSEEFIPRRWLLILQLVCMYSAAIFFTGAGIVGHDTGRRTIQIGVPEETRWIGGPIWIEIAMGMVALAYALFKHRQFRRELR
jgi:hypothetical protein